MRTLRKVLWGEAAAVLVSSILGAEVFLLGGPVLPLTLVVFALCNMAVAIAFCLHKAMES